MRLTNASTHEARSDVTIREILSRLATYEDAEDQGRLVILPKALYEACDIPLITGVTEWEVTGVRYYDGAVQAYTVQTKNVQTIIDGREIGKTVFLARAEAEAALKRGQDDGQETRAAD